MSISVVIPAYNREKLLPRALASVQTQSLKPNEVIIVDDGSLDNTPEVISKFSVNWPELKYIRQENAGAGAARNTGIRASTGEYIAFLDSDDEWAPEKLKKQYDLMYSYPSALFCFCDTRFSHHRWESEVDSRNWSLCGKWFGKSLGIERGWSGLLSDLKFAHAQAQHGMIYSPTQVMIRRDVLLRYGGYKEEYRMAEDYELWLRLSLLGDVCYLDEPLACIFIDKGSTTQVMGGHGVSQQNMHKIYAGFLKKNIPETIKNIIKVKVQELWSTRINDACLRFDPSAVRKEVERAKNDGWTSRDSDFINVKFASCGLYLLAILITSFKKVVGERFAKFLINNLK